MMQSGISTLVSNIGWLWSISPSICEGAGAVAIVRRLRFMSKALTLYDEIARLRSAPEQTQLAGLVQDRPEFVGAVIWPYQCVAWGARERLGKIQEHCDIVDELGKPAKFSVSDQVTIVDLEDVREGLCVVLDQPKWFMREGQLVINLFLNDTRLFSLAFSLSRQSDELTAVVGAIQGRDIDGALELYRNLTKDAHGMRPRDLLIEIFRMLCDMLGVTQILAVSDDSRHHRSSYFGSAGQRQFATSYNEIWQDRGGEPAGDAFYRLPVRSEPRDIGALPAKKRAMYRRRYEMLRTINERLRSSYETLRNKACDSYQQAAV